MIVVRLRAELLRLGTQRWVWAGVVAVACAGAWTARWSPDVVTTAGAAPGDPAVRTFSLAGALELAAVHVGTGAGVLVAALAAAQGPGRDVVDGRTETLRATGRPGHRLGGRLGAVLVVLLATVPALVGALLVVVAGGAVRGDAALRIVVGDLDVGRSAVAVAAIVFLATWVLAVVLATRTPAAQLAAPAGIVLGAFLVSRLSPLPVTPDGWLGPLLALRTERQMLDAWWSVGGDVAAPWGNAALLTLVGAAAVAAMLRADRRSRDPGRGDQGSPTRAA